MPNIELHGFGEGNARIVKGKIAEQCEGEPFADGMVFTTFQDRVEDIRGLNRPFVRLCSTDSKEEARLVEILTLFGIDIEVLSLKKFIEGTGIWGE